MRNIDDSFLRQDIRSTIDLKHELDSADNIRLSELSQQLSSARIQLKNSLEQAQKPELTPKSSKNSINRKVTGLIQDEEIDQ